MRTFRISIWVALLLVTFSQQVLAAQDAAAKQDSLAADRAQAETLFKAYADAYSHKNMEELLAVYPDLQKDQKEFKKVKQRFDDTKVSNEHVEIQVLDMQTQNGVAILKCKREETYVKAEDREASVYAGLWRTGAPTAGSSPDSAQSKVKKSENVWVTLRNTGKAWTIASMSTKKTQ